MNLYPLKLTSITNPKVWGEEIWHMAQMDDRLSVVENGYLAENDINDLLEVYMGELVGEHVYEQFGNTFPLLLKIIDTTDNLSIQVHPDTEFALKHHHCLGKSEMWYVVQASDDSIIISGFNTNTNDFQIRDAISDGKLLDILNKCPVKTGDVAFIPSGRVHALGKHLKVAEIQQNSDITYRLFDYNRQPINGVSRPLHVDQALKVLDYNRLSQPLTEYKPIRNGVANLETSEFFITNLICFDKTIVRDYAPLDSFVVYMCVAGNAVVIAEGVSVSLHEYETILIPAALDEVMLQPDSEKEVRLLEVYVP